MIGVVANLRNSHHSVPHIVEAPVEGNLEHGLLGQPGNNQSTQFGKSTMHQTE